MKKIINFLQLALGLLWSIQIVGGPRDQQSDKKMAYAEHNYFESKAMHTYVQGMVDQACQNLYGSHPRPTICVEGRLDNVQIGTLGSKITINFDTPFYQSLGEELTNEQYSLLNMWIHHEVVHYCQISGGRKRGRNAACRVKGDRRDSHAYICCGCEKCAERDADVTGFNGCGCFECLDVANNSSYGLPPEACGYLSLAERREIADFLRKRNRLCKRHSDQLTSPE